MTEKTTPYFHYSDFHVKKGIAFSSLYVGLFRVAPLPPFECHILNHDAM